MQDSKLEANVKDELFWDPQVDSGEIAVSADYDGTVTLRGTVGSLRQKLDAKRAAERLVGVTRVENALNVRVLNEHRRDDGTLRAQVLQALMLDSLVPSTVDAKVSGGWVTLTGVVDWQFQRNEAERVAGNILGVVAVDDEIDLIYPTVDAGDVRHSIKKAFERSAKLDAKSLSVETSDGTVILSGTVRSWSEHDEAISAAWAAPGVTSVDDRILIDY
jgi:osmotically-inducible protein OsmY